jgi:hypothetical protein
LITSFLLRSVASPCRPAIQLANTSGSHS